jgi:carbon-monoxide dehydrogenase small subunit
MTNVALLANRRSVSADVEPRTHLADFLRETQNLTGTHIGCEHGVCGACTVLIDGEPARSCITYAVACQGAEITTIEGLDEDEVATELRAAFKREHGLQCGYCTPGMIVSARDVVLRLQDPSEHEIRVAMSGNLCRCTGYVGIIRAIQGVIAERRARGPDARPASCRTALGPVGAGRAGGLDAAARPAAMPKPSERKAATAGPGLSADWKPSRTFQRSFSVSHPADEVWAFFARTGEVARCLPGASLAGETEGERVEGQIRVKVGPISAEFQGVADIHRDEANRTGRISGAGKDQRSGSTTRGLVTYAVRQGASPDETVVDLGIGYTLTGMLAQFGRSGLVEDVANRLIDAFAANLESRLSGGAAAETMPSELNAGSLFASIVATRFRQLFARIFGRDS